MFVLILIPRSGVSCPVITTKLEAEDANTTHGADINLCDKTFFYILFLWKSKWQLGKKIGNCVLNVGTFAGTVAFAGLHSCP